MRLRVIGLCLAMALGSAVVLAETAAPATKSATQPAPSNAADKPSSKPDAWWTKTHDSYLAKAKAGGIDLYFEGDSITAGWAGGGKAVWAKEFGGWNPGNFGIGGDRTQHVLWRLENGELEGVKPKVFVLMIGTNNLGGNKNEEIVAGNKAILKKIAETNPQAKVLLLGVFPRWISKADHKPQPRIKEINTELAKMDDGKNVKYLDIGEKFLTDGELPAEVMPDGLHPNEKGYQVWADAIKPVLTQWLGAPAAAK